MVEVKFEHWKYEFSEEDLQYGSPNKSTTAKSMLRSALTAGAKKIIEKSITFTEKQILCANEAFPESALADPLADLRVWNEWRSGVRIFPYPGIYSRLSITNQPGKANSPSSVGVIGEIMAGLFGQVLIGPDILVRVIRQWPDFIFYPVNGRYGFLEAKAFTPQPRSFLEERFEVPKNELGECLINAVRHLTIDPFVKVWYAFTEIQEIEPTYRFYTRFFELDVPDKRRDSRQKSVPSPVIDGLAERAIQRAIIIVLKELQTFNAEDILSCFATKDRSSKRKKAEQSFIFYANKEIQSVLSDIRYNSMIEIGQQELEASIKTQVHNLLIPEGTINLESLSSSISNHEPILIREIGLDSPLYKIELLHEERTKIARNWVSDLTQVNIPLNIIEKSEFWRCGSTAFSLDYVAH